jgi:hypothetical protein
MFSDPQVHAYPQRERVYILCTHKTAQETRRAVRHHLSRSASVLLTASQTLSLRTLLHADNGAAKNAASQGVYFSNMTLHKLEPASV